MKPKQKKGWSLRYRQDKERWVLSVEPLDGGRQWEQHTAPKNIQREADAKAWVAGILSERALQVGAAATAADAPKAPRADGDTVRELYGPWIVEAEKRVEQATAAGYRSAFKAWILPMLGDEPANGMTVPRLRAWVRKLREQKAQRGGKKVAAALDERTLSPMRVANTFSALSVFLSDMIADEKVSLTSNPCLDEAVRRELPERPRPGQVRIAGARPGVPTMEDGQAAIDAEDDEALRVRFVIGFGQGFRDGEISGLRLSRIVLDADVPHFIVNEAVKLKGPAGYATPGKVKTPSSQRTVPMHPAVAAAIRDWLAHGWRDIMHRAPAPNDFLLPGARGGPKRPRSADLLRDALVAAKRPTERVGKPVTFGKARNAFATALAEADVPREARKLLMGHNPDDVDEAHYTAHALGKLAGYIARVPLRWTSRSAPVAAPAPPAGNGPTRALVEHAAASPAPAPVVAVVGPFTGITTPPPPVGCLAVCLASGQAVQPNCLESLGGPGESRTRDQRFRKTSHAWPSVACVGPSPASEAVNGHQNNGPTSFNGPACCLADPAGQAVLGRSPGELKGLAKALQTQVLQWDLLEAWAGDEEGAANDDAEGTTRHAGGLS